MNILLLLAHSIEEHDQLKLLSSLGYDVFSLGGYIDPAHPHEDKRPPLPEVPLHPELKAVVDNLGTSDNLTAAKMHIPDDLLDWADVIMVHHYEHTWLVPQWDRIRHKRVIWRTVGQSVEGNEQMMAPLHRQGLEIVRYSPKERNIPGYAGEDALIRFYKDPDEWYGWTGDWLVGRNDRGPVLGTVDVLAQHNIHDGQPFVGNVTQDLAGRDPWTNFGFWERATEGLPSAPAGPGSEAIGGVGALTYDAMRRYLRGTRAYLYTGTQPASYTLGLVEAMMTGVPVVSIGPSWMRIFASGADQFEGHELAPDAYDDPQLAAHMLRELINDRALAQTISDNTRRRAIDLFGREPIARQWLAYLGSPTRITANANGVPVEVAA